MILLPNLTPGLRLLCSLHPGLHSAGAPRLVEYHGDFELLINIMHTVGRFCIGIVIISCALISACTRPTSSVGPKFSGRLLLLAGENTNGANLLEVNAAGSTYNYSI